MRPCPIFRALALLLALVPATGAHAQGTLTPPGAPAPTMKTLDQVEPRTRIPGGSAPYVITAPGSYYLGGNLQVAGGNAVTINSSNVSLDLAGFTISTTASPAAGTAVLIASGAANVSVRNGHIFGPGTVSATGTFSGGGFASGISYASSGGADSANGIRVQDLTVTGCSVDGISLYVAASNPSSSLAERCIVRHAANFGVAATTVRGCSAFNCGFAGVLGVVVADCVGTAYGSGGAGIQANQVTNSSGNNASDGTGLGALNATNCYGYSVGGTGLSATIADGCSGTTATGSRGLSATIATNCQGSLSGNSTSNVTPCGLFADRATNCYGQDTGTAVNQTGIYASSATGCTGFSSNGVGLTAPIVKASTGRSGSNKNGISATTAENSQGFSAGGIGLNATESATGCYGEITGTGGGVGLFANTVLNCTGKTSGGGTGLLVGNVATNSFGVSVGGTGLRAPTAMNCFGQSSAGTAAPALFAVNATNCRGWQTTNVGFAIQTDIAVSCTTQAGPISAVNRYNMPSSP